MEKFVTVIKCPNKVWGYPVNYKGRKHNDGICHCSKTQKIWNDNCLFIGGFTEFFYENCQCLEKVDN